MAQTQLDAQLDQRLIEVEDALKARRFAEAVVLAEKILQDAPSHIETQRLLSAGLRGSGRIDDAMKVLRELVVQEPDNALIHNSLGTALRQAGDIDGAVAAFRTACELAPDLAPAWYNYGVALLMRHDVDDSLQAIDRVIELAPGNEQARILRSDMIRGKGRIQHVTAEFRDMLARDPRSPWAWFGLANLKNLAMSEADLRGMQRALTYYPQPGRQRSMLLFSLAKALDDHERYAEAFAALAEGNAAMHARLPWDAVEFSQKLDATLAAFSPPPQGASATQGREVIFIVSLPRAGSTLAEQILASHPQIEGAGERDDLHAVIEEENQRRGQPLAGWAQQVSPEVWEQLGKRYLQRTAKWRERRPRFTDKMLANWRFVGAALAMLPDARIVVCRRDPVENCFSCYRQMFSNDGHTYSYDFEDMAAYWRDFDRACRRWQELYPGRVYDFVYEDLLKDQEAKTRELLAFCDLDFDPACLRFYETQRHVKTISSIQVREPLKFDTARAPCYGALLDPLRADLGLPPFAPSV